MEPVIYRYSTGDPPETKQHIYIGNDDEKVPKWGVKIRQWGIRTRVVRNRRYPAEITRALEARKQRKIQI